MAISTWNNQPNNNQWNNSANWEPSRVPSNNAVFSSSSTTNIAFLPDGQETVGSIEFTANASSYCFNLGTCPSPELTISGKGVVNQSDKLQSFIVAATSSGFKDPQLKFVNSATAGGSNNYYCAGPESKQGYGGGVISFCDNSTAGSAIFKVWTGAGTPPKHSTVGGEVSFCDESSAGTAQFSIYGSLGDDGDTFGNVVFHDTASAEKATFINVGGTVSGGDGGNTQFYGNSSAAYGIYNNYGGTHNKANGGDVAFDATADGGYGRFFNHAAPAAGAYGGVTSFNNNPPYMDTKGASAGNGEYYNFGAREGEQGGGGHLEFSARYGSPTGANATISNYGSTVKNKSSAGHTIFSINLPTEYFPTAGSAKIWNHPAVAKDGAAGFTEFSVYGNGDNNGNSPTAGDSTIYNLGGYTSESIGGYTVFSGTASAGNATLIAYAGTHGGSGGKIAFYDESEGANAKIQLFGNGELDICSHNSGVTIGALELDEGLISIQLGTATTTLSVAGDLTLHSTHVNFALWKKDGAGFSFDTDYRILNCTNLSAFSPDQFKGNSLDGVEPTFLVSGNDLKVVFRKV